MMSENLLEAATEIPTAAPTTPSEAPSLEVTDRPDPPEGVPAKFWDSERGELRTDALVKSYRELERKLGATPSFDAPASPEEYCISSSHDLLTSDPEVNSRLHQAGFTQEQAQLVYDLAADRLAPLVSEVASTFEADKQVDRLIAHFGSADRWKDASRQINTWGAANLPEEVFDVLATTYEGVLTIHRMMTDVEPDLMREGKTASHATTESELKQMMRDPRYWRDADPKYVDRVRDGFRRLYPS